MVKDGKQCEFCAATTTPIWRRGPSGKGTLCNACGVKWGLRQRQGGSKRKTNKKSKSGQIEALHVRASSSSPWSLRASTPRRSKEAALQQFQEFERNSSNDESERSTPADSPDSEGHEHDLNLLEHLLFVAESKYMKERELSTVRSQLSNLQQRINLEIDDRSEFMRTAVQETVALQSARVRQAQRELGRAREEFGQQLSQTLQQADQRVLRPDEMQLMLAQMAAQTNMTLAEVDARLTGLQQQLDSLQQASGRLNRTAASSLAEISQLLSVIPVNSLIN